METIEERMRQFTIVMKIAMQTHQIHRGGVRRRELPNLPLIAAQTFDLTLQEYQACYHRARIMLKRFERSGPSSDDGTIKIAA